jgi:hypothetical protein
MHRVAFLVVVLVACLTVAAHIWGIPALLDYPLVLGTLAHAAVTPDSLAGVTDAHGGILDDERIGFFVELLTNVAVYFLLTIAVVRLWGLAGNLKAK